LIMKHLQRLLWQVPARRLESRVAVGAGELASPIGLASLRPRPSDCRRAGLSEDDRHTAKGVFRMEHQLSAASWAVGSPEFGTPLLTINNSSNFFDDISKIIERISEIPCCIFEPLGKQRLSRGSWTGSLICSSGCPHCSQRRFRAVEHRGHRRGARSWSEGPAARGSA
jgi:hypothetical protein